MYRVNIVAAPPGERPIGEVKSAKAKATTPVTQPSAAQSTLKEMPLPKAKPAQKTPARATPSVSKPAAKAGATDTKAVPQPKTEAPKAGRGPVRGKGNDGDT